MRTSRSQIRLCTLVVGLLTLALAALSAADAGAAAPSNGTFTGRTAQGRSVSLTVRGGAIRTLRYGFKVGGCGQTATTRGRIRVTRGKFRSSSSTFDPSTLRSYRTTIAGTFGTSTSVRGTIKANTACGSKRINFSAHR